MIKRILVENPQYKKLTRTMNQKLNLVKPRKNLRKKNTISIRVCLPPSFIPFMYFITFCTEFIFPNPKSQGCVFAVLFLELHSVYWSIRKGFRWYKLKIILHTFDISTNDQSSKNNRVSPYHLYNSYTSLSLRSNPVKNK